MAIEAAEIRRASELVSELASRDVSDLSHGEFLEAHDAVARLGRLSDALRARFAGEVARRSSPELPGGGLARTQGFGNAAAMIASVTGGSRAGAWRSIEAGLALAPDRLAEEDVPRKTDVSHRYPAVAAASLAGELSVDAAAVIVAGLETLTESVPAEQLEALEARLVAKAAYLAAHEVGRMVASAVARADVAGLQERERRQYEQRCVSWSEDLTGMVTITARLDPVSAAPVRTVLEQIVTLQFRNRRDRDPLDPDLRTVGQMRADALFEICRHAIGCKETDRSGVRTTVVVRVNRTDLGAGAGLGTIDGATVPVSVGELRRLSGDAGVVAAVLGADGEVLGLGRTERMFTRAQRLALLERDGGCAKCHAPPEHCEAHHIHWWEAGGGTDLANGVMLCTRCHHDVHRQGWDVVVAAGRVSFTPPSRLDPARRARPGGRAAIDVGDLWKRRDDSRALDEAA